MDNPTAQEPLSGREVLKKVMAYIIAKNEEAKRICFVGRPVYVKVANEIDDQHERYGYMVFIQAHVMTLAGRRCWIIANSIGSAGDPAASLYLSDLMVVPVPNVPDTEGSEILSDWAREIMVQSQYFCQSPMIVLADQRIQVTNVGLFSTRLPTHKKRGDFLVSTQNEPEAVDELAETLLWCMAR